MVIHIEEFTTPEKHFNSILSAVEHTGECIVETPGAIYTLNPNALERLTRLLKTLTTTNFFPMLKDRGPGCDGCIPIREKNLSLAVTSLKMGKHRKAQKDLKEIEIKDYAQCKECEKVTFNIISRLEEVLELTQISVTDFTRTPVITSFSKYFPQKYQVEEEYEVPIPGGVSFRVRLLNTERGIYYDPLLPVESLGIKAMNTLNKVIKKIGESSSPRKTMETELDGTLLSVANNYLYGLGNIQYMIYDKKLTDIYIYPTGVVEVSSYDRDMECTLKLTSRGLEDLASSYRRLTGEYFFESDPLSTYFWEEHNCRISAIGYTGNYTKKPDFAIRIWPEKPWHILNFVHVGSMDFETAAILTAAANFGVGAIIGGGRGTGKSTMLQTFLFMMPRQTRKIALLTAREIHSWFTERRFRISEMRVHTGDEVSSKGVPISRAVKQMLVHGESSYILFNEIKYREEAIPFFTAAAAAGMSSLLTTLHTDSAEGVIQRLLLDFNIPVTALRTIRWIPMTILNRKAGSAYKRRVFGDLVEVLPFREDPLKEDKIKHLITYNTKRETWTYAGVEKLTDKNMKDFVKESDFLRIEGEQRGLDSKGVAEYILLFRDVYKEIYNMYQGPPNTDAFLSLMEHLFVSFPKKGFEGKDRNKILRKWRICVKHQQI